MSAVDTQSFRAAMARFPGAVTIVTASAGPGPAARRSITATAVCFVNETLQAGSHSIFIGQITALALGAGPALIYAQSSFHRLAPL